MDNINLDRNINNSSEDNFHALVDHAPDAIFVVNKNGVIEYANNQATEVFGYSFSELVGQQIELLIPENFSTHHLLRQQYFNSPSVRTMGIGLELSGITKDRRVLPVGISLSPFVNGVGLKVIATVRDISFRKQAENEIKKLNSELLSLDHAKTMFLQIISHELRTPLHGIISFTNMIKEKIDSPELLSYFEYLTKLSERLENFTDNALNITKLRLNEYEFLYEKIPLQFLINTLIKKNNDLINEKGLTINTKIDESISLFVDKELISICFYNICNNAIKFSPIGGEITIIGKKLDSDIEIAFIDTGSGFSDESLERQFKLFATENQHFDENIGLGLALCKMILDSFSGQIVLSNIVNGGAHVQLYFPKNN